MGNMGIEELQEDEDAEEDIISTCTPNSLMNSLPSAESDLRFVHVLELWPIFPQCEHFLPISLNYYNKPRSLLAAH